MKRIFKLTATLIAVLFAAVIVSACNKNEPIPDSIAPIRLQYLPEMPKVSEDGGTIRIKLLWEYPDINPRTLSEKEREAYYNWDFACCYIASCDDKGNEHYGTSYDPIAEGENKVSFSGFEGLTVEREIDGDYVYLNVTVPRNNTKSSRYFRIDIQKGNISVHPWLGTAIRIYQDREHLQL